LPRLAAGETVTAVAFSLGYSSTAAFTSMFRRVLGATPRDYFGRGEPTSTPSDALADELSVA
jgi:AraC-like DNA-binding protein